MALVGIAILGVVGVIAYLQHPVFGELPSGDRLARIERSPNHAGGVFHNQIDTPMRTTDQSEWSMWMQTLFGEKGQVRPPGVVHAVKTDLKALDPAQDLVVWLGHSSYFVQLGGQRVLIDPVFSVNAAPIPGANKAFEGTSLYAADDMPEIDALLTASPASTIASVLDGLDAHGGSLAYLQANGLSVVDARLLHRRLVAPTTA